MASLTSRFCRCIKRVRRTVRLRPGQTPNRKQKERAAIGICVRSVLQSKGKTVKRFTCGKRGKRSKRAKLVTQTMKKRR